MKINKSYSWMYVILTYFIITLVGGIFSLFNQKKKEAMRLFLGNSGFLLDFSMDVILLIILLLVVVGIILKLKWAWKLSLIFVALIAVGIIIGTIIGVAMPGKLLESMATVYDMDISFIPKILFLMTSIIGTIFNLILWGLIGRYIYRNKKFFKK